LIVSAHPEFKRALAGKGVSLRAGPFTVRIRSPLPQVASQLELLYADFPLASDADFVDFHVRVAPPQWLRRWVRPQVQFDLDGHYPFKPLPLPQGFAMLEWGINWCISAHAHQYLILHAAVLERHGRAVVLPAPPGSGKSTLAAALSLRGWRLLSDELALIDTQTGLIWPIARPVSLKNQSIDIIRKYERSAIIGEIAHDTIKGSVAHLKPTGDSVARMHELAKPAWVVFPQWRAGEPVQLTRLGTARAFLRAVDQGFNYSLLGEKAFHTLAAMLDTCACFDFTYSDLDQAIAAFEQLNPAP